MQGGVLKALETCSGGQAGGVSAQDSGRVLTLWHCLHAWSGKQNQSSKAMKSPPIWQKFRGITKTRENGANETKEVQLQVPASQTRSSAGISAATEARPTWYIGGDRSEAYLHCGAAAVIF
jgi:hypothetical protein